MNVFDFSIIFHNLSVFPGFALFGIYVIFHCKQHHHNCGLCGIWYGPHIGIHTVFSNIANIQLESKT